MKKINLYLFSQIAKSCTLIFFIFISIAWLLQFSRLINVMSHLHINTLEILYLSLLIVPNLTNVIMPFILIFGFVLSFIKLSRDREIMAIYSSGISINEIIKPLIIISFLFIITSLILSFIISPKIYDYYKKSEFNLRNTIQFEKIDVSNFIKFNENLTIDFEKYNSGFKNILINIDEESEILIFAKKGKIDQTDDRLTFKLIEGFKTEIKDNSIENLNFDSYFIDFPIDEKKLYKKTDPNTIDIFELLNENKKSNKVIILLRPIRKREKNGSDYFFVKKDNFIKLKKRNFFIETAKVFNYLYGSPIENIDKALREGNHILFDIDWQGAKKLRKKYKKNEIIDFFILPPSKAELKKRLIKRGRENNKEVQKRLSLAVKEMSHFNEYKYVLVNQNINQTVSYILKIIQYEEMLSQIKSKVKTLKIL